MLTSIGVTQPGYFDNARMSPQSSKSLHYNLSFTKQFVYCAIAIQKCTGTSTGTTVLSYFV